MRVVVMWEHESEIREAENLAKVLASLAPSLAANAKVSDRGEVETSFAPGRAVPKVIVLAESYHHGDMYRPYRHDAESLAAEAQRFVAAQEAALGDRTANPHIGYDHLQNVRGWWGDPAGAVSPYVT